MMARSPRIALIDKNLRSLAQALEMLQAAGGRRMCGHLLHVVEFYACFLNGLDSLHIDYDACRCDAVVDCSPANLAVRIHCVMERLQFHPALDFDNVVFVRVEDAATLDLDDPYVMSSVARELMALDSHTLHHFGMIAATLAQQATAMEPASIPKSRERKHKSALAAA